MRENCSHIGNMKIKFSERVYFNNMRRSNEKKRMQYWTFEEEYWTVVSIWWSSNLTGAILNNPLQNLDKAPIWFFSIWGRAG